MRSRSRALIRLPVDLPLTAARLWAFTTLQTAARGVAGRWGVPLALLLATVLFLPQVAVLGKIPDESDHWVQDYPALVFLQWSLRHGDIPFWNPYLVAGVPYLADPQSSLFYLPQTLAAFLLPAALADRLLILGHYFLAAIAMYGLARVIGLGRAAALVAALAYPFGQHFVARSGQIFPVMSAFWLPAILLCCELGMQRAAPRWGFLAGLLWALQFFRGSPQISYATALVVACYCAWWLGHDIVTRRALDRTLALRAGVAVCCALSAAGAAAVQLGPTLELFTASHRVGGFSLADAADRSSVSFATLLGRGGPDVELRGVYPGLAVLLLAALGLGAWRAHVRFFLALAVIGLLVSAGNATPVYGVFYRTVPGFALWHAPSRFFFVPALGLAMLAAFGAEQLSRMPVRQVLGWMAPLTACALLLVYLATVAAYGPQAARAPDFALVHASAAALPALLALALAARGGAWSYVLPGIVALDLLSFALPRSAGTFFDPAVMHRMTGAAAWLQSRQVEAAAVGQPFRIISVELDPGASRAEDNPYVRRLALLPANTHLLVPGLQAAQGYLPMRLESLGEYMEHINPLGRGARRLNPYAPHSRLVDLLNVRYLLTDAGTAYRLPVLRGMVVRPGQAPREIMLREPAPARRLRLLSSLGDSLEVADGTPVAELTVTDLAGNRQVLSVRAGFETAEWAYERPDVTPRVLHRRAPIARQQQRPDGTVANSYVAEYALHLPAPVASITLARQHPGVLILIDDISLEVPLEPRWREVYRESGLRILENTQALPRAWVVYAYEVLEKREHVYDRLRAAEFDPLARVILEERVPEREPVAPDAAVPRGRAAQVSGFSNSRMTVQVAAARPGLVVLSDAYYPGWQAWVDGKPAPIYRANAIFRAVPVPAGEHTVTLAYRPVSLLVGGLITAATLGVGAALVLWGRMRERRARSAARSMSGTEHMEQMPEQEQ